MQPHHRQGKLLVRDMFPYTYSKTNLRAASSETCNTNSEMGTARKLRDARKAAGYTQAQVAREFGISREAVALWESEGEKGTKPDIRKLRRLAELYKISIGDLLDESADHGNTLGLTEEQKQVLSMMAAIRKEARDAWLAIGNYLSGKLPERRRETVFPNPGRRFGERGSRPNDNSTNERRTN